MEPFAVFLALTASENWRQFMERARNLDAWGIGAVLLALFVVALANKDRFGANPIKSFGDAVRFAGAFAVCIAILAIVGFSGYGCWRGIMMFLELTPVSVIGGFILFIVSAVVGLLLASLAVALLIKISDRSQNYTTGNQGNWRP